MKTFLSAISITLTLLLSVSAETSGRQSNAGSTGNVLAKRICTNCGNRFDSPFINGPDAECYSWNIVAHPLPQCRALQTPYCTGYGFEPDPRCRSPPTPDCSSYYSFLNPYCRNPFPGPGPFPDCSSYASMYNPACGGSYFPFWFSPFSFFSGSGFPFGQSQFEQPSSASFTGAPVVGTSQNLGLKDAQPKKVDSQ